MRIDTLYQNFSKSWQNYQERKEDNFGRKVFGWMTMEAIVDEESN